MISLVKEVNQLFTVRQIVDVVEIQTVDDSGGKGKACRLSHEH